MTKPRICLNMIVKDESRVIERSLASVRDYIDYWVIVDTGSTDDTKEKIRSFLADIPGELHERPWKNFGHNRNEALELAREHGDYLLFTDASLIWKTEGAFEFPTLTADGYHVRIRSESKLVSWKLMMLASTKKSWYYYGGESHAVLHCDEPFTPELLKGIYIHAPGDGSRRSSPKAKDKYIRDIEIFKSALAKNPLDTRATFYLAQSYRDTDNLPAALEWYERRSELGEDPEEVWLSLLQVGAIKQALECPWEEIEEAYLVAYKAAPWRAEPIYPICEHYRRAHNYHKLYLFAKKAIQLSYPEGAVLHVEDSIYEWRMLYEFAVGAYCVGHYGEAAGAFEKLLNEGKLPEKEKDRVHENLKFSLAKAT